MTYRQHNRSPERSCRARRSSTKPFQIHRIHGTLPYISVQGLSGSKSERAGFEMPPEAGVILAREEATLTRSFFLIAFVSACRAAPIFNFLVNEVFNSLPDCVSISKGNKPGERRL